jgi:ferredoxin
MADGKKKIARITVDRNLCIGAASCVLTAPDVFELDGENKAVLKLKGKKDSGPASLNDLEAAGISEETILAAAQSCPTKAIIIHDEEGNQLYP